MQKTTVYLPDDLKAALQRLATDTGSSEAELIRKGVRLVVAETPPLPNTAIFVSEDPHFAERVEDYLIGFGQT